VNEIRNDLRKETPAKYHLDALDFVKHWHDVEERLFDTVILDPPYSYRKSMEMYRGAKNSRFKRVKDLLPNIMSSDGRVITFGYHSISMGRRRNFKVVKIVLFSHGGAIHDTIMSVEQRFRRVKGLLS